MNKNKLVFVIGLIISMFCNNAMSYDYIKEEEILHNKIQLSGDIDNEQYYQYTREDVEALKLIIRLSLDILTEKKTFSSVFYGLDVRFEGGEDLPKKFFAPITSGKIIFTHFFREPTSTQRGIYGYYSSYIKKKNEKKYWNFADIGILGGYKNVVTIFDEDDFTDFGIQLKKKIFIRELPLEDMIKYSDIDYDIEDLKDESIFKKVESQCYAIYRYEKIDSKFKLNFDFCVAKDFYMESSNFPSKWKKLIIERLN